MAVDKWVDVFTFNSVAMEKLFRIFNFPLADQQLSFLKLMPQLTLNRNMLF